MSITLRFELDEFRFEMRGRLAGRSQAPYAPGLRRSQAVTFIGGQPHASHLLDELRSIHGLNETPEALGKFWVISRPYSAGVVANIFSKCGTKSPQLYG